MKSGNTSVDAHMNDPEPQSGKEIKIFRHHIPEGTLQSPVAVTLGKFDGIHLGHQKLLSRLCELSPKGSRVVVMLYPHPAKVLKGVDIPSVQTLRLRARYLEKYGVDCVLLVKFDLELAQLEPAQFLDRILIQELGADFLVVGEDAAVGRQRAGDAEFMRRHLAGRCEVEILSFDRLNKDKIGTRKVAEALQAGDCALLLKLLGRYHSIEGRVVAGEQRARTLGFPTANVKFGDVLLPPDGVYATMALVDGCWYRSVTNIGVKPTFGNYSRMLECHLLEYSGADFYGERIQVSFISSIRGERRFGSAQELAEQIRLDINSAHNALQNMQEEFSKAYV